MDTTVHKHNHTLTQQKTGVIKHGWAHSGSLADRWFSEETVAFSLHQQHAVFHGLSVSSSLAPPCWGLVCQNWWWQTFSVRTWEQIVHAALWWGWAKCGFPSKSGQCDWKRIWQRDLWVVPWCRPGKTRHDEYVCSVNGRKNTPKLCFFCQHKAWVTSVSGLTSDCQTHITGVIITKFNTGPGSGGKPKTSVFPLAFVLSFLLFFSPVMLSVSNFTPLWMNVE